MPTVWISRLIAPSPFSALAEHQQKVWEAAGLVPVLVEAALAEDQAEVRVLAKQLSVLENEADEIKNRIRDTLPQSRFIQVSRPVLIDIVAVQDSIADACEDIGVLFTMRPMEAPPAEVRQRLTELVMAVGKVVARSGELMGELEALSGVSFSGAVAQRALAMIDQVDREEHEADKIQDQLAKAFFRHEDEFKPAALYVWMKIFSRLGTIANRAEKLAHRIRLFLAK